eukprot:133998-Rhodomonas_salina.1
MHQRTNEPACRGPNQCIPLVCGCWAILLAVGDGAVEEGEEAKREDHRHEPHLGGHAHTHVRLTKPHSQCKLHSDSGRFAIEFDVPASLPSTHHRAAMRAGKCAHNRQLPRLVHAVPHICPSLLGEVRVRAVACDGGPVDAVVVLLRTALVATSPTSASRTARACVRSTAGKPTWSSNLRGSSVVGLEVLETIFQRPTVTGYWYSRTTVFREKICRRHPQRQSRRKASNMDCEAWVDTRRGSVSPVGAQ